MNTEPTYTCNYPEENCDQVPVIAYWNKDANDAWVRYRCAKHNMNKIIANLYDDCHFIVG